MMHRLNIDIKCSYDKDGLLRKLRENRDQHETIVKEARRGYLERAKQALLGKLEEIERGSIARLQFRLAPPEENLAAYDTVIQMLEDCTDESIELTASEFRQLVMDEWDWSEGFYVANKMYSPTAHSTASEKGF